MSLTFTTHHVNNSVAHPGRRNIWRVNHTHTGGIIPDQKREVVFDNLEREYADILCRTLDHEHAKRTKMAIFVHHRTTFGPDNAPMSEALLSEIDHLVNKDYLPVY